MVCNLKSYLENLCESGEVTILPSSKQISSLQNFPQDPWANQARLHMPKIPLMQHLSPSG